MLKGNATHPRDTRDVLVLYGPNACFAYLFQRMKYASQLGLRSVILLCIVFTLGLLFGYISHTNPGMLVCLLEGYMSLVVRKPVFGDSDQVRQKTGLKFRI